MAGAILDMKLLVPPLRSDYVRRDRLTARLREGLARRLIVLSTPAGFGKTTVLCEWIREQELPAAWLSLDQGDNDPGRFFSHLHASIARTFAAGSARSSPLPPLRPGADTAEDLLACIVAGRQVGVEASRGKPRAVIVLDDYHAIENPAVHREVAYFVKNLPEELRLAVASRTEPPLPLSLLRAQHEVLELHERDLRFSHRETEVFLNEKNGLGLTRDQLAALDDRTEGWIAGLQLAALAIEGREDVDRFVRDFAGSNRYVLDYLADEVFNRQTEEAQRFLLRTSILDRMTAELCDAVTGEAGSQARLERLERENLFIIVLDDRRKWYRYHHLFADLLRTRLSQRMPGEEADLHRAAARWYESDGQAFEAAAHAFAARDYALAVAILDRATIGLAMAGEVGTLLSWLDMLPPGIAQTNPQIPLLHAWGHFLKSDIGNVEVHVRAALAVIGRGDGAIEWKGSETAAERMILAQASALRAYVAVGHGRPEEAAAIARATLERLPAEDRVGRSTALDALGDALRDMDDFIAARGAYLEALAALDTEEQRIPSLALRMDLARIALKTGALREAERASREVIELAEGGHRPTFPLAQAYILLGDILRERDDLDGAEAMLALGVAQCGPAGFLRYLCAGRVAEARCAFARGDFQGMDVAMMRAREAAEAARADSLVAWAGQWHVRINLAADRMTHDELDRWLSAHPLPSRGDPPYARDDENLTIARALLHRGRGREGSLDAGAVLGTLEDLARRAANSGRKGSLAEILVVKARVLDAALERNAAVEAMGEALSLAEPEGWVRLFADEGSEVLDLVQMVAKGGRHIEAAARITAAARGKAHRGSGPRSAAAFSERELEILRLIAVGMDNQEIADKLFISVSTVKSHITRLYNRLGVESRTQSIVRARELGLA